MVSRFSPSMAGCVVITRLDKADKIKPPVVCMGPLRAITNKSICSRTPSFHPSQRNVKTSGPLRGNGIRSSLKQH